MKLPIEHNKKKAHKNKWIKDQKTQMTKAITLRKSEWFSVLIVDACKYKNVWKIQ